MFSDKTIALAEEYMKIQRELKASIEEDLKCIEGTLCTHDTLQIWADEIGVTDEGPFRVEKIKEAIGEHTVEKGGTGYAHMYYKIGSIPAVTLIREDKWHE